MRLVLVIFAGLPLSTLLLGFLLAAALTVGLYILRLRRRPVSVAFLPLWEKSLVERKASALRSRLQRLLSLLLSLLLVAALILALGDPRSESEETVGRSIVVLLDVSASMGEEHAGRVRLDVAKEKVSEWFSSLGPGDEMLLIELGARPRPLGARTGDKASLKRALSLAQVLDVSADLAAGLRLAKDALRARERPQIILVSDGALATIDPTEVPDLPPFYFESVGQDEEQNNENVGITAFSARRYALSADRFEVLVELSNSGREASEIELALFEATPDGKKGAQLDLHRLTLPAESSVSQTYENLDQARSGLIAEIKRVDERKEHFIADNIARTLLPERVPAKILVVGKQNNFLEAALLVDEGLQVKRLSANDYPPPEDFDITIFDGVFPKREKRTGAALYLGTPEKDGEFPLQLGSALQMFGFDTWREQSKVFRSLDPYNIQVLKGHALLPQEGDVVLGASQGKAIMVRGTRAEGDFLALGFSPRDSDFVLRTAWPLFVLNVVDELFPRGRTDAILGLRTGTLWRPPVATSAPTVRVRGPLGEPEIETWTVPIEDGHALLFGQRAGFYESQTEHENVRFAASLLSGEESKLAASSSYTWGEKPLEKPLGMDPRPTRRPWFWLLVGVFAVSFAEWWLYHRRWTV